MIESKFVIVNSNRIEQKWLEYLVRLNFNSNDVDLLESFDDLFPDSWPNQTLLICDESEVLNLSGFYLEHSLSFPVLLVSSNKKIVNNDVFESEFTIDLVPRDLLSPSIMKLMINSLFRDYKKDRRLRALAHFDNLTGAANRHLFSDRLEQTLANAKRYKQPLSIAYFDLDKFKPVNDTYGHHVGDQLLKLFVDKVKQCLRSTDTLGRLGGDEFALLMPLTTIDQSSEIVKRILHGFEMPVDIEGYSIKLQSSVGLLGTKNNLSDCSINSVDLMKKVDEATYIAKKKGNHDCFLSVF